MKQYKLQELVGNTKKLPCPEKHFYETLINFRKLPECAQLFLPLQIQSHIKAKRKGSSLSSNGRNGANERNDVRRQCSREEEEVQSYSEWKVFISWMKLSSWKNFKRLRKSVVYILPVGPFPEEMLSSLVSPQLTFLQALVSFGEAFFMGISLKVLPVIEYKEIGCKTRFHNKTGQLQLLLPDLMEYLATVMPKNAAGIVALSWIDFYPDEYSNSILGEGSVHSGCAAISFGHYELYMPNSDRRVTPNRCHASTSVSQSIASEQSYTMKTNRENRCNSLLSQKSTGGSFHKSKLDESSRRMATSSRSININRSSIASNGSIDFRLSRSASSYKHLGSLSSIDNSWTKVFSKSIESLCSSTTVDDESYDIINRDEADDDSIDHGIEEDMVKHAVPVSSKFKMSCSVMWRLFKELAHEVSHIFGLSHCNFYECVMNSSNQISEVDEQPIFLCPVCLRKLQRFLKFRLASRYWKLADLFGNMQPCYSENISISRDDYVEASIGEEGQRDFHDDYLSYLAENSHRKESSDGTGHICIEVTRERNEGYDIINVEYKNACDAGDSEHECHLTEARTKLENIVSFLNRY